MKKEHSRRWTDTEEKIGRATLDLMQSTNPKEITVSAICKEAKINRTTFYEHFLALYDLFDKIEREFHKDIMSRYESKDFKAFSKESFIPILTHIRENKNFYRIILKSRSTFPINQGFEYMLNDVIRPLCRERGIVNEKEILYYLVFFQAGFTFCLRRWVEGNCAESEEKMAEILVRCVPAVLTNSLVSRSITNYS